MRCLADHRRMSSKKSGAAWMVSAALACSLFLTPAEARADGETLEALPFMVFAAAFSTLIIVYAVNNPADRSTSSSDSSSSTSTDDTTSSDALRNAHGPMGPAPVLGFSGRF